MGGFRDKFLSSQICTPISFSFSYPTIRNEVVQDPALQRLFVQLTIFSLACISFFFSPFSKRFPLDFLVRNFNMSQGV